jgi:hypothetical protein
MQRLDQNNNPFLVYRISAIISIIMPWTVETLNATVDQELGALPADLRARFVRIANLIEEFGLDQVGAPHVRHLQGAL